MEMRKTVLNLSLLFFLSLCISCNVKRLEWVSLGDSITWQDGKEYKKGENKGEVAKGYQSFIISSLKPKVLLENRGISGLPLTEGSERGSLLESALSQSFTGFDLITIAVGTNDFKLNKNIGEYKRDPETFTGAFQLLIEFIRRDNANCKIVLFTPLHRDNDSYTSFSVNKAGFKLTDYMKVINEISELYELQVVDMFNESGINPETLGRYTLDGLHPNDDGYKEMSKLFLKTVLLPYKTRQ